MNRNITIRQEVALKNTYNAIRIMAECATIVSNQELDETLEELEDAFPFIDFELS